MAQTKVFIKDAVLKSYLLRKYINTKFILDYLGLDVKIIPKGKGISTKGFVKAGGGIPFEYVEKLNSILKDSFSLYYFNNKVLFNVSIARVREFFNGKTPGYERMRYVEKGTRASSKYFFFSVSMQKVFANKVNPAKSAYQLKASRNQTRYSAGKRKNIRWTREENKYYNKDRKKRQKTKPKNYKKRTKAHTYKINEGENGEGVMAIWANFSKAAQGLLFHLYGEQQPTMPAIAGIKIENTFVNFYQNEGIINTINEDQNVIRYVENYILDSEEIIDAEIYDMDIKPSTSKLYATAKTKNRQNKRGEAQLVLEDNTAYKSVEDGFAGALKKVVEALKFFTG
jgi:hypothetical protein